MEGGDLSRAEEIRPMSIAPSPPPREQRFLLTDVSWAFYEHLLRELNDRPVRVTYDRGSLELMAPSYRHEVSGRTVGILAEVMAEEFDLPLKCAGSTTFRREDVGRGIEPDNCFYIANLQKILGKRRIDLSTDPPPDLAIEVDVSRSSLDRMGIYAALRVPEVWRWQDEQLRVHVLAANGEYEERPRSPTFPQVPLETLADFVRRSLDQDDITLRRDFRAWLRRDVLPTPPGERPA